jgi:uncharacterized membrane protein YdjX (TVP38/TMEM64 family)
MSVRREGSYKAFKLVAAAVAIAALLAAMRMLPLQEWLKALQGRVDAMGPAGAVLYGAAYVIAALLLVPGSLLTIGAGLWFGLLWGTVIVSAAATAGAAAGFLIARHLARSRVQRFADKHERFGALDRAIRQKGWKVVALLRLSPLIPYSLSNYLYGLTPLRLGPYLLASWAGMLPGTVLYVYLGAAGRAAARGRSAGEWTLLAGGLVATAVVTIVLTRAARRNLEQAKA